MIIDIDMEFGPSSVAVVVSDLKMVEKMKKLNSIKCLGEVLKVRRVNEESIQTTAQASAMAIKVINKIKLGNKEEMASDSGKIEALKSLAVSSVIKVSNVFDREAELDAEKYEELLDNMTTEFEKYPHFKRIKIIRNSEAKLGAEVGAVFVEFFDKRSADLA